MLYHAGSLHTKGHPMKAAVIRPAIKGVQSSIEKLQFDVLSYQYCMLSALADSQCLFRVLPAVCGQTMKL